MNRQAVYGADVLSRIDYSNNNGIGELQACITSQLAGMIAAMLRGAGAVDGEVTRIVAAGNTTMLHFLTGLDPRGIGAAPFTPESLFGVAMPAAEIWPRFAGAELYLPPSVSAYVGADIICGILSTGMTEGSAVRMLIDVGTNGEMALWDGSRLVCCSTAAGPAFEGASISMGMPAVSGAISRVAAGRGVISAVVIDGAPPAGICGSGMISAIDVMLREGVLNGSGKLLETGHGYESFVRRPGGELAFVLGESGVYLTQRDIRNIQLVKASIAAGASVLMKSSGVDPGEIDALYLSGGFGSSMDPGEAAGIGLIPAEASGRALAAGNTALSGAAALLLSRAMRERAGEIASMAEEISLSQSPEFMDEYVERMPFRD
jgi:uncharacterized 2Fe-2S/4Fe-4S cluster protein (DUF4445 family)